MRSVAMTPRSERGGLTAPAILERAVADPVVGGAREEIRGESIVDRTCVSRRCGHDAGRQRGGCQAGVSIADVSIECHVLLPSWLPLRRRRRPQQTNEAGEDRFPGLVRFVADSAIPDIRTASGRQSPGHAGNRESNWRWGMRSDPYRRYKQTDAAVCGSHRYRDDPINT
jgi:hypothetical protein